MKVYIPKETLKQFKTIQAQGMIGCIWVSSTPTQPTDVQLELIEKPVWFEGMTKQQEEICNKHPH